KEFCPTGNDCALYVIEASDDLCFIETGVLTRVEDAAKTEFVDDQWEALRDWKPISSREIPGETVVASAAPTITNNHGVIGSDCQPAAHLRPDVDDVAVIRTGGEAF